ncbi:DNA-(apurinic or apyrimidinic site) endonuclease 2-like [Lineus longissimus]|uniref:DNA-(apurinic or apyrimidinic site) endonuclease 2-like n=1 Tax=Lineus longissimus TaxID=88925 RepID=UPI00315C6965
MKILTWNINGIRAAKESVKQLLDSFDSDIICLQETKITRDLLDEHTALVDGYSSYYSYARGKSGYSGVAIYCKDSATPESAEEGLTGLLNADIDDGIGCYGDQTVFSEEELQALDNEGRCILTRHKIRGSDKFLVLINLYCPRAPPENEERQKFKLEFYRLVQIRAEALVNEGHHVLVLGDINTSHRPIDVGDPDEEDEFMAKPARKWLDQFLCRIHKENAEENTVHQSQNSNVTQSQESVSSSGSSQDSTKSNVKKRLPRTRSGKPITKAVRENHAEYVRQFARTTPGLFVDSFRYFHPNQEEAYTCWCNMTGARKLNYGTRIDLIMGDKSLVLESFTECYLMTEVMGSDHCPVRAELDLILETAMKPPSICTKYLHQFAAKQKKLVDFFSMGSKPLVKSPIKTTSPRKDSARSESAPTVGTALDIFGKKRPGSLTQVQPSKKAKVNTSSSGKQTSIFSMFSQKSKTVNEATSSADSVRKSQILSGSQMKPSICSSSVSESASSNPHAEQAKVSVNLVVKSGNGSSKSSGSASLWKDIFKGPPPAPLCSGHKEPCLLRTVKKDSMNKGRQFWVCNRPDGHAKNPEAKCDFFKWVTKEKKGASK